MRHAIPVLVLALAGAAGCITEEPELETSEALLVGNGATVNVMNVRSGMCLWPEAGSLTTGTRVNQATCNSANDQRWQLEAVGTSTTVFRLKNVAAPTLCLETPASGRSRLATCSTTSVNQRHTFNAPEGGNFVEVKVAGSSTTCLDVYDASMSTGAWVQSFPCLSPRYYFHVVPPIGTNMGLNQLWVLVPR